MINRRGLLGRTAEMFAMDMFFPKHLLSAGLAAALLLLFRSDISASPSALDVVNAGIQSADNEALVAHDYEFLPGDSLHVVFEIAGFGKKVDDEKDTRSISLSWEVSIKDRDGVPLAPPQNGEIKTALSPEDKKWLPKRRAEFALPRLVSAGEYQVHIAVKDLLNNAEAAKDLSFLIGGHKVEPTPSISLQDFKFSREEGGQSLEIPAYRPGDSIYLSFDLAGFAETDQHEYRITYRFEVSRPDGKEFVKSPEAVGLTDKPFYPAKFVPVNFSIETPASSLRGEYTVVLHATDEVSHQTSTITKKFTLE